MTFAFCVREALLCEHIREENSLFLFFHRPRPFWLSQVLNQMFVHASRQTQALKTNHVSRHFKFVCILADVSDTKAFMFQEFRAR